MDTKSRQYHIYRDGARCIIKDPSKTHILYRYALRHVGFFSRPAIEVYRADKSDRHLATISTNWGLTKYTVTTHPKEDRIVIKSRRIFFKGVRSAFTFEGREYEWNSDRWLREVGTGTVIARFERRYWAINKVGVLEVTKENVHILDVILFSWLAVHYNKGEDE